LAKHSHGFVTADEEGNHVHNINRYNDAITPSIGQTMIDSRKKGTLQNQSTTENDGKHKHSGVTYETGANTPFSILPPYYKIAFIMKL
jgi:hypothetical protein